MRWWDDKRRIQERLYTLQLRQALPLEDKVEFSRRVIREWHGRHGGRVCVSYSGGKDSLALLHLVRSEFPDVPAVFVDTGLEYPEVRRAARTASNVVVLRPEMPFHAVLREHGWPLPTKTVAQDLAALRRGPPRPYLDKYSGRSPWSFLAGAPFKVSDRCCKIMKVHPLNDYQKESGLAPFVGSMAMESRRRKWAWVRNGGCNNYGIESHKSAPLSFWTDHDALEYVRTRGLTLPSVYGDIIEGHDGRLMTTGCERTGCVFCCFGIHLQRPPGKFGLLAETHPALHRHVMGKLGLAGVLTWIRDHAPRWLGLRFHGFDIEYPRPGALFGRRGE
jgi:3'-phosphoadenosine 5'-phosphosulfate sulfotransferase (PAPS reductase)/FAD synthetase